MAVVVITGCSSGFGLQAALAFARNDDTVYASMRNLKRAKKLRDAARSEGLKIHYRHLDVTLPATFAAFIQGIVTAAGRIDVLVNNAGIIHLGAWEDLSEQTVREVMETNYFGPLLLAREVLPTMRQQGSGYIIMVSSLSGIAGLAGDVAYTASKFALDGATEALRHEVDRWGIHVALVLARRYATNLLGSVQPFLSQDYPDDSLYRRLIEAKLRAIEEGNNEAKHPRIVGELLVEIAGSDGTRLRWPADELSREVMSTLMGPDSDRDSFLRSLSDTDWWSEGQNEI